MTSVRKQMKQREVAAPLPRAAGEALRAVSALVHTWGHGRLREFRPAESPLFSLK